MAIQQLEIRTGSPEGIRTGGISPVDTPIAESRSPMTGRDKGPRMKERGWGSGEIREEKEQHKNQGYKE